VDSESWAEARRAFDEAAAWFVRTAAAGSGRWNRTALGEWTVRDLVGHTSRALLTVETYLDRTAASVDIGSAVDYFGAMSGSPGDPVAVAQRGRDAGAALGADVPAAVAEIADRVVRRINDRRADALVATPVGGMRLSDYLPTRTFELTVHTCDLAVALDQPLDVPEAPAVESLTLLARLTASGSHAGTLLLAATGRRGLPPGFTVL
jgi:hypothetical protein